MADTTPMPRTSMSKRQRLNLLKQQLQEARQPFEGDWREIDDFIAPGRLQLTLEQKKRRRASSKIIDSTASYSLRTLSSGLMSGITSSAREWFQITTPDPDLAEVPAVKEWLHTVTKRLQAIFARSNWYKALAVLYKDAGAFATGTMFITEDDANVIQCTPIAPGRYWIAVDEKGHVRTLVREFNMNIDQLVNQFGYDRLSTATKVMADNQQWNTPVSITHVVQPNREHNASRYASKYKAFYNCYYETNAPATDDGPFLEETGFDEWPVLAMRWEFDGENAYGSDCPGMMAIGDIRSLQQMKKLGLQGLEKMVKPPMVGPPELQTGRASILAGDITYIQERGTRPAFYAAHETKISFGDLRYEEGEVRNLIRRAFYEDVLLMFSQMDEATGSTQPRTAAEIGVRDQEKLLVFGPMLEQMNEDVLNPGIDRVFGIALRRGHIPPAPPELEGQQLRVEYISIMHSAQKAAGIDRLQQFTGTIQALAQERPDVWDKVNLDEIVDELADQLSIAPKIIVPDEQVAEVRQKKAQAAQQQQAAQAVAGLAPAAKQLSETDLAKPSALTALMSSQGAAALSGVPT
jgi:hypothetical protein